MTSRPAPRRLRSLPCLVLVALSLLALTGSAEAASVRVPALPDALAYGGGRVLWADVEQGELVVRGRSVAGGPPAVLARVPRARPGAPASEVRLAADGRGYVVALRDGRYVDTGECGCDHLVSGGELVLHGSFDGAATELVRCRPASGTGEQPGLTVAGGSAGFALAGARCGTAGAVTLIDDQGAMTPVPDAGPVDDLATTYGLAYAEPYVAVGRTTGLGPSLRVIDTATHAVRDRSAAGLPVALGTFDMDADGTVALADTSGGRGLFTWRLDADRPQRIPSAKLGDLGRFRFAGGRVLHAPFDARPGLALANTDGSASATLGEAGAGAARQPLFLDGTTAVFTSRSCRGAAQVTVVDLAAAAAAEPGCPVRVRRPAGPLRFGRDRRASMRIACPNGCRVRAELYLHDRRVNHRDLDRYVERVLDAHVAEARLDLPAATGYRPVRFRLLRPAVALLRRYRHVRVRLDVSPIGTPSGPELVGRQPAIAIRRPAA